MRRLFKELFGMSFAACWLVASQQALAQGTSINYTKLINPNPDGFFGPDGIPVYTGHPTGPYAVLSIDLNHDGIEDYRVVATGTTEGWQVEGSSLNAVWSRPTGGNDIGGFIVPLAFGTEIGATLPASDEWMLTQPGPFGVIAPGISAYTFAGELGLFIDQTAYAGLRFQIGSDTYYGWMKMQEIPALRGGGVVFEYAYDIRPNTPIFAGTVPEPSAYVLLVLGGFTLWLFRRR